jgi:hypothetical protein
MRTLCAALPNTFKHVLRRRGVTEEHFEVILERIMEQAEAIYAQWPLAA